MIQKKIEKKNETKNKKYLKYFPHILICISGQT